MRPRFVIVNAVIAALAFAAWHIGLFADFPDVGRAEIAMCAVLLAYGLAGAVFGFCGHWAACGHIAHSLPIIALGFTGLGLLLAVSGLGPLDPAALATVFRALAFAILPNVVGVALMAWLRELGWWSAGVVL